MIPRSGDVRESPQRRGNRCLSLGLKHSEDRDLGTLSGPVDHKGAADTNGTPGHDCRF